MRPALGCLPKSSSKRRVEEKKKKREYMKRGQEGGREGGREGGKARTFQSQVIMARVALWATFCFSGWRL